MIQHRGLDMVLAIDDRRSYAQSLDALDLLRAALKRFPGEPRLLARHARRTALLADWRDGAPDLATIVGAGCDALPGIWTLCITDDLALQATMAGDHAAHVPVAATPSYTHPRGEPKPHLRIGYISADFRDHAMGQCVAELFERHDRDRFTIFGYALNGDDGSALHARLAAGFDHVAGIGDLSPEAAAARIRADGIDILVDLIGYSTFNGCAILGLRPAPIQASLLGFPSTKAAPFIDYLIGDAIVFGDGAAAHFTEKLVRLPDTYFPTDSRRTMATRPSRAEAGLPEEAFVFCCFNYPYKFRPDMFDVWMAVLRQAEGAVLWLLASWPGIADNLRREAASRGVDPARLVFAPFAPIADHLTRLGLADLALDTLPCGAHTTGVDALWAGVPMLTCLGRSFAGRVGASLLQAIGLPELVAPDLAAYAALAVALSRDRAAMGALRRKLEENRLTTPLFDGVRYARNLEAAYAAMWTAQCSGTAEP